MRRLVQTISGLALLGTAGAPVAYLVGAVELGALQAILLVATIGWFALAPLWVGRRDDGAAPGD